MEYRKTFRFPDHILAFIEATRNPSEYVRELIEARMSAYAAACVAVTGFSRPALMAVAVADVQNGHMYTPGLSNRDEIVMNLEDAPDVLDKWGVSAEERERLLSMDEATATALRLVVDEFWAGREMP